jgi:Rubredoxin
MDKYVCTICGYVYDEEKGDIAQGVKPGTPFKKLPKDWFCEQCEVGKEDFEKM